MLSEFAGAMTDGAIRRHQARTPNRAKLRPFLRSFAHQLRTTQHGFCAPFVEWHWTVPRRIHYRSWNLGSGWIQRALRQITGTARCRDTNTTTAPRSTTFKQMTNTAMRDTNEACAGPASAVFYGRIGRTTRLEANGQIRKHLSLRCDSRRVLHRHSAVSMECSCLHLHILPSAWQLRCERSDGEHERLRGGQVVSSTVSIWHRHSGMPNLLPLRYTDGGPI
jgi:hypothetical protein